MPKGPGSPLRPRKRPLTDEHIQASVARGMNEHGHYAELVYAGCETYERALEIKRSLYRCAKFLGYSMKADIEDAPGGGYQVRFKAIDKARARAYITQQYKATGKLAYNPYAKGKGQQ